MIMNTHIPVTAGSSVEQNLQKIHQKLSVLKRSTQIIPQKVASLI